MSEKMPEVKSPFPRSTVSLRKKAAIKILLKSVIYAFAIFGILFILLLLAVLGVVRTSAPAASVPQSAVLVLDFDELFSEVRQDSLLTEVAPVNAVSFHELLMTLATAARDKRVKALAGRINDSALGLAQMQELRQAIQKFRATGKPAYIYSPGFGNLGGGTSEYYLASAFSKITMQPNSEVGLTGISAEVPFFRSALDKIGVTPEFYSRYEYKTAMASFTDKNVSPAFREDMNRLLGVLNVTVVKGLLNARFQTPTKEDFFALIDKAPFSAEYAKTVGLVDELAFEGEWLDGIKKEHDAEMIGLTDYAAGIYPNTKGDKLAVIVMEGMITDTPGGALGEGEINAGMVLAQLDEIKKDRKVKGLLVRVNSPGGSYTASAEIWNALNRLKKEKKIPLIVSMGDYAASGGYFISLAGDKIFADETTLTGSIGVLGGKFVLEDLWKKLDVRWEAFDPSPNAGILSPNFKFSKSQKSAFNKSLDRIYKDFTLKVSEARKIPLDKLDTLARGRVFVGAEAKENGLVDAIGGFDEALGELKRSSGFAEDASFVLEIYPKPKTLQEKIGEILNSAPVISLRGTAEKLGLDIRGMNVLKQLQYDAVMPPFRINM